MATRRAASVVDHPRPTTPGRATATENPRPCGCGPRRGRRSARAAERLGEADEPEGEAAEEGEAVLEELSTARHIIVQPDFLAAAEQLRGVFDERFADPRRAHPERFMWDYWHIPEQYTLIRTQARPYFPAALYSQLEEALLSYGETQLGCRAISPIWMSYYLDGCHQALHCDNPHGPFAFVLSLTRWEGRPFRGGETLILRPEVLSYWQGFDATKGLERGQLMESVEPHFNQLLVFDPRFPHAVAPVSGTHDPRTARLVLHGWFTEPAPFFDGPLPPEAATEGLDAALGDLLEELSLLPPVTGTLTVRLSVSGDDGSVQGLTFLADTLVARPGGEDPASAVRAAVHHATRDFLTAARFAPCEAGDSQITLPLVFD